MQPILSNITRRLTSFLNDESGGVLEYVMVIGLIALPLVGFLAIFGRRVVEWVQKEAPNIFDEASSWVGG